MYKPLRRVLALIFTNFRTNSFNLLALSLGILICAFLCWIVSKLPFIGQCGLNDYQIKGLLVLKIVVAVAFAFVVKDNNMISDYSYYNKIGLQEFQILKTNPGLFLSDFGQANNKETGELFSAEKSFYDDLSGNIMVKILAIFNIFTQGNFYLNTILFSLIGFIASIGLVRIALMHGYSKIAAMACAFFVISCTVFTAAIHKDTIVFYAMAMSIHQLCLFVKKKRTITLLWLMLFLLISFSMRNYVVVCLIPAALVYLISEKLRPLRAFTLVYGLLVIFILAIQFLSPSKNLTTVLSTRQSQFLALPPGNSHLALTPIQPTLIGVIKNLPEAVWNVSMSPLMVFSQSIFIIVASLEIILYLAILLLGILLFSRSKLRPNMQLAVLYWSFTVSVFLIIGLIVPNAGAIIRYRAIFLPLFLLPFFEQILVHIRNRNI